jgi:hypothetical protein
MKKLVIISILILSVQHLLATGQRPDYLIVDFDTIPIHSNPLKQYLDKNNIDFLQEIVAPYSKVTNPDGTTTEFITSTSCWRGYVAYWRLKNDSLILNSINPCCTSVPMKSEEIILKIFGQNNVFANWYSGTLSLPAGELFSGADMGYNSIYEYEDKLQVENGLLKSKKRISNIELIEQLKLDNKLYGQIPTLKDNLLFYLKKNIDWKKIDNTNCDCSDSFILSYDKNGRVKKVEYIKLQDETDNIWYRLYEWRFDKKCSRRIKSAIKALSLEYLYAHRDFQVEIKLFYRDYLEMWECHHYFRPVSDEEIEEYVKKQMDIKE